jgi:hypothetical protein
VATTWLVSVEGTLPATVHISTARSAASPQGGGGKNAASATHRPTQSPTAPAAAGGPQQSAPSRDGASGGTGQCPTASASGTSPAAPQDDPADGDGFSAASPPAASDSPTGIGIGTPGGAPSPSGSSTDRHDPGHASGDEGLHGKASAHRGDPDTRDRLLLTVDEPLTALEVEVRVGSAGAADAGAWTTMPGTTATVERRDRALVYRFTLGPGEAVQPGSYTFTVQYADPGEHDPAPDTWVASAFTIVHPHAVTARGQFG